MRHFVSEEAREKMNKNSASAKQVICIETKTIYPPSNGGSTGISNNQRSVFSTKISNNTKEYRDTHTRAGFHWAWVEDYNKEQKE